MTDKDNILDRAFVALFQTVPIWAIITAIVSALILHFQNVGLKAEIAELENRRPYIIHVVDSPGGMMLGQVTDKVVIDGIYTVTIGHNSRYRVTREQFDSINVGDSAPEFLQQKGAKQ